LRLALLTDELMPAYMEIVEQDYTDYYFFIYDVLLQRERTKVWLAIENEEIVGLMLVYNDCMVQLRGSPVAVGFLLSSLSLENVEVQATKDCEDMLLAKFPVYRTKENITLMQLRRGTEKIRITTEPEKLTSENAEELAALMREVYPLMWGEMTGELVKTLTSPKESVRYGIRVDGRLAAFGTGILTRPVGVVSWLGTLEQFRRRGYCTALVSVLVRDGLKSAEFMAIHVLDDNAVAKQIYESVGFRSYRRFVLFKT
jgi:hypothetical protein